MAAAGTAPSHWRDRPARARKERAMPHLATTVHLEAPVERVFALGSDFRRYPEWNVTYREVLEVTGEPVGVGTKMHLSATTLGQTRDGWDEVVEYEPPRLMKTVGRRSDGTEVTITYSATPSGTGTDLHVEMDYELPAGILAKIADKLFIERAIERDVKHSIENFQAIVEQPVPVLV
jgi:uncharacterized membrane protein